MQEPLDPSPITLQQESIVFASFLKKILAAHVDFIQSNPDTISSINVGGLTIIGTQWGILLVILSPSLNTIQMLSPLEKVSHSRIVFLLV